MKKGVGDEEMENRVLWKLMQEVTATVFAIYEPVVKKLAAETGLEVPSWGLLLDALTLEPKTASAAHLQVRGPYTAAERYVTRLAPVAEKGFLAEAAPGEYRLTEAGRKETQRFIDEAREAMAEADPLPPGEAKRLVELLRRLLGVSLSTPPPPDTWAIRLSLKLMPATDPPLPYTEQAISCLAGYRDDAHLAAWQPSGLSAAALETLTLLWRGEADSLEKVCGRLAQRGHPPEVYARALSELRERGFAEGPDDGSRVTAAGRDFRDEVESKTDRYFFGPWASMIEGEKKELARLLTRLRDGLRSGA